MIDKTQRLMAMRRSMVLLFVLSCSLAQAVPPRVHADHQLLVDDQGHEVSLRGINWSEPDFCTVDDMARMKDWQVNVVRVWCSESSVLRSFDPSKGRPKFDVGTVARWASDYDVYVIFVIGDLDDRAANQARPWSDRPVRERFRACLRALATGVKDNPAVLAIEVQNEPPAGGTDLEAYREFHTDMARTIRRAAPQTMVAVHGPLWLDDQDRRAIVPMGNILYVRNFWEPRDFTHTQPAQHWPTADGKNRSWIDSRIAKIVAFRDFNRVPVMVTEFGAMIHAPDDDEIVWVKDVIGSVEASRLPALYWGYKSYRSSSFHIYYNATDRMKPPVFVEWTSMLQVLRAWWSQSPMPVVPAPVPTQAPHVFEEL